jgi:hypothetical protein
MGSCSAPAMFSSSANRRGWVARSISSPGALNLSGRGRKQRPEHRAGNDDAEQEEGHDLKAPNSGGQRQVRQVDAGGRQQDHERVRRGHHENGKQGEPRHGSPRPDFDLRKRHNAPEKQA